TAGTIPRAPAFMRRLNLEWAWRIFAEPSLWRRYWNDGLALARLSAGRLLAALGGPAATGRPGAARAVAEAGATRVLLSGDLCADDLQPVRTAFRDASRAAGDVILDFTNAGRIDAAFLGQVLMLEKAARRRGAALFVDGAAAPVRRLLKAHSIAYPQAPSAVARERETGDAGFAAAG
ncbi:MAG TPA: hypothetical protein DEA50_12145, partial [Parvularcula sp.]|nr:hypothetical protein [Parvularcula sp.]